MSFRVIGTITPLTPPGLENIDTDAFADFYRKRYAAYLASSFRINFQTAASEALYEGRSRRRFCSAEVEIYLEW